MKTDSTPVLSLAELQEKAGQVLGVSPWYQIDQAWIDRFADVTRDRYFIHTDPRRAAAYGPYGGTIAHGFLILSLLSDMAGCTLPRCDALDSGVNYGFDKVRFISPVRCGRRVRSHFTLQGAERREPHQALLRYAVRVEIEGEEQPALIAEWLSLLFLKA